MWAVAAPHHTTWRCDQHCRCPGSGFHCHSLASYCIFRSCSSHRSCSHRRGKCRCLAAVRGGQEPALGPPPAAPLRILAAVARPEAQGSIVALRGGADSAVAVLVAVMPAAMARPIVWGRRCGGGRWWRQPGSATPLRVVAGVARSHAELLGCAALRVADPAVAIGVAGVAAAMAWRLAAIQLLLRLRQGNSHDCSSAHQPEQPEHHHRRSITTHHIAYTVHSRNSVRPARRAAPPARAHALLKVVHDSKGAHMQCPGRESLPAASQMTGTAPKPSHNGWAAARF